MVKKSPEELQKVAIKCTLLSNSNATRTKSYYQHAIAKRDILPAGFSEPEWVFPSTHTKLKNHFKKIKILSHTLSYSLTFVIHQLLCSFSLHTQRSRDINWCRWKSTRADLERGSEAKQLKDLRESQRVAGYAVGDRDYAWSRLVGGLRPQCESDASDRHQDAGGNHYLQWVRFCDDELKKKSFQV